MEKKHFRSGQRVSLAGTGDARLDGAKGYIVGIASVGIVHVYIVELDYPLHSDTPDFADFGPVLAITMPEYNLVVV